ncbi:MAG TPA: UDP-N-acetylmuramoyl-L-alanine--D-glutamate ligase [Candidatus Saccharimonadales bacterium]
MKIALLGYGVEGKSAYTFLSAKYPQAQFTVYDENTSPSLQLPPGVQFVGGQQDFHDIAADYIVRTPAIHPDRVSGSGEVTSVTKLFFAECPAHIIGVTGSKGKGTTASFITSILRAAGKTVHLLGNIGLAALDELPKITKDDIVVYELSSYQLWDMTQSPPTAVVLMIEADHLDVHGTMDDYIAAKANIGRFQTPEDRMIFYASNENTASIAQLSPAQKVPYPTSDGFYINDGNFWNNTKIICSTDSVQLPAYHNLENALAAIIAVQPWVTDGQIIAKGLSNFHGLPHRLKYVDTIQGVAYFDDSIATIPGAVTAAIKAFAEPKVLILGGTAKVQDFTQLAAELSQQTIRKVLLIGRDGGMIASSLDRAGVKNYELLSSATMPQIVDKAAQVAQPGDVVLLSPACASYDMFENYKDRGDQFIAAVKALAK